jgi:hypothetical protein
MVKKVEKKRANNRALAYSGGVNKNKSHHNSIYAKPRTVVNRNSNFSTSHYPGGGRSKNHLVPVKKEPNKYSNQQIANMINSGLFILKRKTLSQDRLARFWRSNIGTRYHNLIPRSPKKALARIASGPFAFI